jgi:hypothetical protein
MSRATVVWNSSSQNLFERALDSGWSDSAGPTLPTGKDETWLGLRVPVQHPSLGGRGWTDCLWRGVGLSAEAVAVAAGERRLGGVHFLNGAVERCAWMESTLQRWVWQGCVFREVDLRNAAWSHVVFKDVEWNDSDWSYSQWSHCVFDRVRGWAPQGRHAHFQHCVFIGIEEVAALVDAGHVFENAIWIDCRASIATQEKLRKQGHLWVAAEGEMKTSPKPVVTAPSSSVERPVVPPAVPPTVVSSVDRFGSVERMGSGA